MSDIKLFRIQKEVATELQGALPTSKSPSRT